MGVDGISVFFVLLSVFLTPICILSAWDAIKTRVREFMIAFLFARKLYGGDVLCSGLRSVLCLF
ncbi:MAG: hypothetical protein R3D66_06600 [Alphaproteobacteria bacterium]